MRSSSRHRDREFGAQDDLRSRPRLYDPRPIQMLVWVLPTNSVRTASSCGVLALD